MRQRCAVQSTGCTANPTPPATSTHPSSRDRSPREGLEVPQRLVRRRVERRSHGHAGSNEARLLLEPTTSSPLFPLGARASPVGGAAAATRRAGQDQPRVLRRRLPRPPGQPRAAVGRPERAEAGMSSAAGPGRSDPAARSRRRNAVVASVWPDNRVDRPADRLPSNLREVRLRAAGEERRSRGGGSGSDVGERGEADRIPGPTDARSAAMYCCARRTASYLVSAFDHEAVGAVRGVRRRARLADRVVA